MVAAPTKAEFDIRGRFGKRVGFPLSAPIFPARKAPIFTDKCTSEGEQMEICNRCVYLLPTEHEEFEAAKKFDLKNKSGAHHCLKYDTYVFHDKNDNGYGAPIYPCEKCRETLYAEVG